MRISSTLKPLVRLETKQSDESPPKPEVSLDTQDSFETSSQISPGLIPDAPQAQGGRIRSFLRSSLETAKAVTTVLLSGSMMLGGVALMGLGVATGPVAAVAGVTVGGILAKEGVKLLVRGLDASDQSFPPQPSTEHESWRRAGTVFPAPARGSLDPGLGLPSPPTGHPI